MPTFYQCFLEYQKRPDAIKFSKKKIKKLHGHIRRIYDRHENPPISYLESQEGDKIYQVRDYPNSFKKTIVDLLNRLHEKEEIRLIQESQESKLLKITEAVNETLLALKTCGKIRRRKTIIKPEFSAKPSK